jgi:tetratricopeptide (TPR) repeat protein
MKVGNVELETDPAQALKEFQLSLQSFDALSVNDRKSLITLRLRAITVRKEAMALEELGEHTRAVPFFDQALAVDRQLSAADPTDLRALTDVDRVLEDAASSYESASDPELGTSAADRLRILTTAETLLEQSAVTLEQLLKRDPANGDWVALLASTQVRIGTVKTDLHQASGDIEPQSRKALATLEELANKPQASPSILDLALKTILNAEPASLRDPSLAVQWAERGVELSHRKTPSWLLSLAQAYRAAGQQEKSRAAAREGLALLPALQPGSIKPNIRKLLEFQTQAGK